MLSSIFWIIKTSTPVNYQHYHYAAFAFVLNNKAASLYGFVLFMAFSTLVLSTTAVLYVEKDVGNIQIAEDALWWGFVTITTVGYGHFYPVTNIGKSITFLLIVCGIASFGTAISWINQFAGS